MALLGDLLVGFVALEHFGFLLLEMFLWEKPLGRRVFHTSEAAARETAVLAKNQGLYNGFLAAGLVWSLVGGGPSIAKFFLGCVIAAGLYGGATANRSILLVQALPALIALAVVWVR